MLPPLSPPESNLMVGKRRQEAEQRRAQAKSIHGALLHILQVRQRLHEVLADR